VEHSVFIIIIADWLKPAIMTLFGAVIGFGSAIASEVWKSNRTEKRRAKRIEHAIYSEIADIYQRVHNLTTGDEWTEQQYEISAALLKQIKTEAHQYAKSNPEIFYLIPNALNIDEIYRGLHIAQNVTGIDGHTVVLMAYMFVHSMQEATVKRTIDVDLFKQTSSKTYDLILKHIEADKTRRPVADDPHISQPQSSFRS
jgi:hypothetical protein